MKTVVWSKQHRDVLASLDDTGRYVVRKEYIGGDLQENAKYIREAYDWYVCRVSERYPRPADVRYPVWVSLSMENTMIPSDNTVILELEIDADTIMPVNINKWSMVLNYSYIPKDGEDARRHYALLKQYGVSDAKAYMSSFYPQIKMEIVRSWERLFDEEVTINGNRMCYGTVWELRKEWLVRVL